ncbi:MAG: SAM-dependent methyltransferase [Alphaproteobacteria bacterium]|nr:SAM-dependent methyltransferase [Alphaproteobacteria bacterium]
MSGNDKTHVAMTTGGAYSIVTRGAKDVIDGAWPLVMDAIGRIPDRPGSAFTLTDIGTADGGTSLEMIGDAIAAIRGRFPERDIQIVYTDQPRNDYNAIFRMVHGLTGQASYLERFDRVQVLASATSFYDPILPRGTLDLGFSATAMHWLSRKPCDIPDHVQAVGASGASLSEFQQQAARDWEAILLRRAAELAPGGRLVLVNFGVDDEGRYLGNTGGINMFDTFDAIWRGFVADGTISQAEYAAMTLPQYYKNVQEFRAPLDDRGNPVSKVGLSVEHCETRVVPCPFAAEFKNHGDAARFARDYVPTLRSWSAATFRAALDNSRPDAERDAIIENFYGTYETMVREAPEGHAMDYVHVYLTIARES